MKIVFAIAVATTICSQSVFAAASLHCFEPTDSSPQYRAYKNKCLTKMYMKFCGKTQSFESLRGPTGQNEELVTSVKKTEDINARECSVEDYNRGSCDWANSGLCNF